MVDEIRDKKELARRIGVTYPLFDKYLEKDSAPRSVMLAVFWETSWGISALHTEYENQMIMLNQMNSALTRALEESRRQVDLLEKQLANDVYGAANSPVLKVA